MLVIEIKSSSSSSSSSPLAARLIVTATICITIYKYYNNLIDGL